MSNGPEVLKGFSVNDLSKDIFHIDFDSDAPHVQRSLGLSWDLVRDVFTFQVSLEEKPYTKRGMLSTINGVFDPLGFAAPVLLGGRLLMRQAIQDDKLDWDEPLPKEMNSEWEKWKQSLFHLEQVHVSRAFTKLSFSESKNCELHVFSDASKEAISAVAYIRLDNANNESNIGFVHGKKSKLAPSHGHTIPRLELCAAVVATELASFVQKYLEIPQLSTFYYTDSRVVLGYINNDSRRFYVYVANRIDRILNVSKRAQWNFVPTDVNPADQGTRPVLAERLGSCDWLKGPELSVLSGRNSQTEQFDLVGAESDKELCPIVRVKKAEVKFPSLGSSRFERFSSWTRLVVALSFLKQRAVHFHKSAKTSDRSVLEFRKETEILILKEIQREFYSKEIDRLYKKEPIPRNSTIQSLSPILDSDGLLRVGGRLKNAYLETREKTPIIIPGKHHIATLLVRHFHERVKHKGRHFTEGAVRSAGYWIVSSKRLISSVPHKCVKCRKLRRPTEHQKMSDLPSCRITPSPPFTYVGVDTFGPWSVESRRTRGGQAHSKRWAIMFSCLNTRAVHVEVIENMSASCFRNALRRFISLRGHVKEFYSDRGTNFVGAVSEMGLNKINVEDTECKRFLYQHGTVWRFSAPHSSHMNGAWERMIGIARRILDSMFSSTDCKSLTHEVLCTLMAEVTCIMNSRPITTVSNDSSSPTVLSPNMLLTQKVNSDIEPYNNFSIRDMYRSQWRQVQVLANQFWKWWKDQYLQTLQPRKKWPNLCSNIQKGDVVLMKDSSSPRIHWPVGIVEEVYPSSDGLVRKVSVRVIFEGKPVVYTRPVTQLILLLSDK